MHALAAFAAALAWFHGSEFALACTFQRSTLTRRSLLISPPYAAAMAAAVAEHWIEASVLGWPKPRGLLVGGLIAAAAGDALRKAAMLTAGASFRHDLARTKRPDHVLVTTGPYAWARHPAYLGFAVWAVSLQAALANPACAAAFAAACLRFFSLRVAAEEALLLRFFGSDYSAYAARTRTWMPGVGGTFC